jgi:hypothetical protein
MNIVETIKSQATQIGMIESSAQTMAHQAYNMYAKDIVVGHKGGYRFGRNDISVFMYCESLTKKWEIEGYFNYNTGSLIRWNKAKYL